jgi:hypothetical protein
MNKILLGATLLGVAIILAGINRGFDISDEGLYVLLADPRQQNLAGIFNYDLFFKAIYRLSGYSFTVVELRVVRLLSYFMAAFALASFWKNISGQSKIRQEIFWLSCLGLFSGYAFLPSTLSYNSLTVVLTSFWLFLISKEQKTLPTILLLGLLIAGWVYVKISLVLVFLPLTVVILIFWQKHRPVSLVWLVLPLIFLELLFQIILGENAWLRLLEGIPLNSQRNGYQIALMVKSIAVGGFWIFISGAIFFGIAFFRKSESSLYPTMKYISIYGVCLIGFFTHITEEWNHLFLLAFAAFFGYQAGLGNFKPTQTNFWAILLILLPFLLHFGSNVYWLRIGIQYLVFWVLAARWIVHRLDWELKLAVMVMSIFLVFNGIWWHPFGHEKPLWSHKIEWQVNENSHLLIDPELRDIAKEVKAFQMQYSQSDLLTAYRIPGIAYLVGSTLPISPSIWEKRQTEALFSQKPPMMVYNKLEDLPENWIFKHQRKLGVFRSDTLQILWD